MIFVSMYERDIEGGKIFNEISNPSKINVDFSFFNLILVLNMIDNWF